MQKLILGNVREHSSAKASVLALLATAHRLSGAPKLEEDCYEKGLKLCERSVKSCDEYVPLIYTVNLQHSGLGSCAHPMAICLSTGCLKEMSTLLEPAIPEKIKY